MESKKENDGAELGELRVLAYSRAVRKMEFKLPQCDNSSDLWCMHTSIINVMRWSGFKVSRNFRWMTFGLWIARSASPLYKIISQLCKNTWDKMIALKWQMN